MAINPPTIFIGLEINLNVFMFILYPLIDLHMEDDIQIKKGANILHFIGFFIWIFSV